MTSRLFLCHYKQLYFVLMGVCLIELAKTHVSTDYELFSLFNRTIIWTLLPFSRKFTQLFPHRSEMLSIIERCNRIFLFIHLQSAVGGGR